MALLRTTKSVLKNSRLLPALYSKRCYSENASSVENHVNKDLPSSARVVVCGGGVLGTSVAYHLSEAGWKDVVLVEQGQLTCGTTWHSAGLIGQTRDDISSSKLLQYSRSLYKKFEDIGQPVGWKECGSFMLAQTKDRMISVKRRHAMARASGVEAHVVTPSEVQKLCPWIRTEDLEGGVWIPGDGVLNGPDVAVAFTSLAKKNGVKLFEGVSIQRILTNNGSVSEIETSRGNIKCQYFVNCSGMWSHQVGQRSTPKVKVPLHACEHFYITTKPIEGMDPMLPVIRDMDGLVYFREWSGGLLAGGFEPVAKPVFNKQVPDDFHFGLLPDDWEHFRVLMDPIIHRIPAMENAMVHKMFNGPESFTPDGSWIIGEVPEIRNYYVAAGLGGYGIVASGGIGRYLSELIIDRVPSLDLSPHDVLRFVKHHNNRKFLAERVKETLAMYTMRYPQQARDRGRGLRTSPLHTRLQQTGACFSEVNGYEYPVCFSRSLDSEDEASQYNIQKGQGTYRKPAWFESVREEYTGCKERVAVIDMSSYSKIEVKSRGTQALEFLQYLSSNNIAGETGKVIHTGMQNKNGGYENDCSIVQVNENTFFIISPASHQTRSMNWLLKHQPQDGAVEIRDVTSAYAGINVIGPHAQQLLGNLSDTGTNKEEFKPMTCKVIDVGYASNIYAMRLSQAEVDGFLLFVPSEYALHVYDSLMTAGKEYGVMNSGHFAHQLLCMENFDTVWGQNWTWSTTPLESARESHVNFNVGDFNGRDALLRQKENGISQRLVQLLLNDFDVDKDVWPWGGEPIYRNGKFCGTTTSSIYGLTLDRMICLGFVKDHNDKGQPVLHKDMQDFIMDKCAVYEIDIGGQRFSAEVKVHGYISQ